MVVPYMLMIIDADGVVYTMKINMHFKTISVKMQIAI